MKVGWEYRKLGDVCNIDFGTRVVRSRDAGSIYPVYGGGGATFKMDTYNRENCMVISRFGMSEQCTRFVKGKFFLNDSGLTLSMKKNCMIQVFMDWQILYLNNTIYSLGRGAAQKNLDTKALAEVVIAYPNNPTEQQRIVNRLDSAFAKIDAIKANAEKSLNEAKALFQASLKEMLEPKEGWNSMKLGDFAYMKAGDFVKASDIYQNYAEGLYPCYGGNGFRGYVNEPNQEGDYCLIGRQGALCGCVNRAKGIFRTTEHAVIVKPYQDIPTSLVYYMLINLNLNKYATGAAQPGLSVKNIAEQVIIPVPPRNAHFTIAATLDSLKSKVDSLQENYEKISQECDALKQSILRQVFE